MAKPVKTTNFDDRFDAAAKFAIDATTAVATATEGKEGAMVKMADALAKIMIDGFNGDYANAKTGAIVKAFERCGKTLAGPQVSEYAVFCTVAKAGRYDAVKKAATDWREAFVPAKGKEKPPLYKLMLDASRGVMRGIEPKKSDAGKFAVAKDATISTDDVERMVAAQSARRSGGAAKETGEEEPFWRVAVRTLKTLEEKSGYKLDFHNQINWILGKFPEQMEDSKPALPPAPAPIPVTPPVAPSVPATMAANAAPLAVEDMVKTMTVMQQQLAALLAKGGTAG